MFSPKRLLKSTSSPIENSMLQASIDYVSFFENKIIVFGWINDLNENWDTFEIRQDQKSITISRTNILRLLRTDVNSHLKIGEGEKLGFFSIIPNSIKELGIVDGGDINIKIYKEKTSIFSKRITILKFKKESFVETIESLPEFEIEKIQKRCKNDLGISLGPDNDALVEIHIDYFLAFGNYAIASGWLFDPSNFVKAIEVISNGEVISEDIKGNFYSIARPDVQNHFQESNTSINLYSGFLTLIKIQDETEFSNFIELRLMGDNNEELKSLEVNVEKQILFNFRQATSKVFASFPIGSPNLFEIYKEVIAPFFRKVAPLWMPKQKQTLETNFGKIPEKPEVSIIIPLYGRFDYMTFQFAQFSNDEKLKEIAELIYVVDDPNIYEGVLNHSEAIYPIFKVPYKIVYAGENMGFARANNYGATFARGKYILCMNSDVFPKTEDWLPKMLNGLTQKKDCGIYSPRLLYEDGSIQYAGMRFEKSPFLKGFWFNIHPGKGQPPEIFDDEQVKEIPAATGACMLMEKAVFDSVNGFDESYLQGDFEDSDLNLKLYEKGLKNYYDPNIELYHLERKSQGMFASEEWKLKLTLYNALNHTERWDQSIKNLNQRQLL